jgi:hypothetical protein
MPLDVTELLHFFFTDINYIDVIEIALVTTIICFLNLEWQQIYRKYVYF